MLNTDSDITILFVSGSVLRQYGSSGAAGREDGTEQGAKFNTPQGMVFHNETLYVADTNNHLIRKVGISLKFFTCSSSEIVCMTWSK